MTIARAIFHSILFKLFIQITTVWVLLRRFFDIDIVKQEYGVFINSTIELIGIIIFFHLIKIGKDLIPKKTSALYYLIAIILGFLYVYSQRWLNFIYDVMADTNFTDLTTYKFDFTYDKVSLNSFAIMILLPISEEIFFRSYIQKGLQKKYDPLVSIGVSTTLFALLHLPNMYLSFLALFGGMISAILYHKSKSVGPSIQFHILWNVLVNFTYQ